MFSFSISVVMPYRGCPTSAVVSLEGVKVEKLSPSANSPASSSVRSIGLLMALECHSINKSMAAMAPRDLVNVVPQTTDCNRRWVTFHARQWIRSDLMFPWEPDRGRYREAIVTRHVDSSGSSTTSMAYLDGSR